MRRGGPAPLLVAGEGPRSRGPVGSGMVRGGPAPLLVAGEAPRSRGPMRRGFDMTGTKSGRGPHPMPLRDGPHGGRWAESVYSRATQAADRRPAPRRVEIVTMGALPYTVPGGDLPPDATSSKPSPCRHPVSLESS